MYVYIHTTSILMMIISTSYIITAGRFTILLIRYNTSYPGKWAKYIENFRENCLDFV